MKITLERQGKNVVELALELEAEKVMRAYEVALRQLGRRVDIPGFRKGKAPRSIIEKTLGVEYIKAQALDELVPQLISRAISDENLDVITDPKMESISFELGQPLKLKTVFEVRPQVQLGQYRQLAVVVPKAELPADARQRAMAGIAESKAILKKITDRPLKMGDSAVIDFECFVEGKLVDGGKSEGLVLEMKPGNFLAGFCEQLEGKEPDTRSEIKVAFPDNYRNKELAGKEGTFHVDLKGIRQRCLPDIDDALAVDVGFASAAELEEAVSKRLEAQMEEENRGRLQRAVVDKAIANAVVDIPDSMIDREHHLMLANLKKLVEENGQSFEEYRQTEEFHKVSETKRAEAEQRVRTSLVLGAIVRAENLMVSADEIDAQLEEMAASYKVPVERLAGNEALRRQVTEELLTQAVVDFLLADASCEFMKGQEIFEEAESGGPAAGEESGSAQDSSGGTESPSP